MATRMQQRRGTAAQWISVNNGDGPTLAAGEIGFETDTGKFKIGDGVNPWIDLVYYASADDLAAVIDGAPALLDTLNELSQAIGDDPDFINTMASKSYVGTAIDNHSDVTTAVHGIADTSLLATKSYADDGITSHNNDTTNVHGITNMMDLATKSDADDKISTHNLDTTNVHGIANTAELATQLDVSDAVSNHSDSTIDVHGIADTSLLATTADVSTAQGDAEDFATSILGTHNSDTSNVHGIADTTVLATLTDIADTENYANDAVSAHNSDQTNVHGIADTAALATKTYADNAVSTAVGALTKSSVGLGNVDNTSDANKPVSTATQTALDLKAPLASPTFTGTVSGITKSMVGLGNVDNTSDANKPVSTAAQTALDLKANLAGPTFTGTVVLPSTTSIGNVSATEIGYVDGVTSAIQTQLDAKAPLAGPTFTGTTTTAALTVTGNLTVNGTTTTVSSTNLEVSDPLIYIGTGNSANSKDLGVVGHFDNGTYQHTGIVRDATDGKWKLFSGVTTEPSDTIDFATYTKDTLVMGALEATSATIGNVSNTELQYLDGVTSAIQTQLDAKAPSSSPTLATPTITGALTLSSSGVVFTDGTQTKEGVASRTPIVQKTASYTLSALTERDSLIEISSASAVTLTIPTNATLALPVGTSIDILQTGAGQVTIAGAGGVTVNATPGLKLRTQWSGATLFKRATDTWVVYGDLSA